MTTFKTTLGGLLIVLSGMGLIAPMSSAETSEDQLGRSSIPEAVDYNSRMNNYYQDDSLLGDTKFTFGLQFSDNSIRKSARQVEALYRDLVFQQDNDNPVVRTQDLPSPFTTSIFSLQSPANFSQFNSTP